MITSVIITEGHGAQLAGPCVCVCVYRFRAELGYALSCVQGPLNPVFLWPMVVVAE